MRAEKADAKRRAAMWAALERKRGRGWSVDVDVETASRPVMPVGMSSMRSSPGSMRLGEEGLEGPERPEWARQEPGDERVAERPQSRVPWEGGGGGERGERKDGGEGAAAKGKGGGGAPLGVDLDIRLMALSLWEWAYQFCWKHVLGTEADNNIKGPCKAL